MNGDMNSTTGAMPAATLREHARVGAVHRLAWTMGHQPGHGSTHRPEHQVASALSAGAARRDRARAALLRLAQDPAATAAERELALTRAAQLQGQLI
jgi:hypothetical protein